jgi:hypothetical protein
VTDWDPPRRFAFETAEWQPSPEASAQTVALELLVEARAGGTCVVRLVNSGFGTGEDWDRQLEASTIGWRRCLAALRLYLTHFAGRRCTRVLARAGATGAAEEAWSALGVAGATKGERVNGPPGFGGVVDEQTDETGLVLLLDAPAPGVGGIAVSAVGGQVLVTVSASLFGEAETEECERAWQAWLDERVAIPPGGRQTPAPA